jgi:hypothetical protein
VTPCKGPTAARLAPIAQSRAGMKRATATPASEMPKLANQRTKNHRGAPGSAAAYAKTDPAARGTGSAQSHGAKATLEFGEKHALAASSGSQWGNAPRISGGIVYDIQEETALWLIRANLNSADGFCAMFCRSASHRGACRRLTNRLSGALPTTARWIKSFLEVIALRSFRRIPF